MTLLPRRLRSRAALGAVLLAAAALRFGWNVAHRETTYIDELFAAPNVERFLRAPSLRPANGFHPSMSWLPAAVGLHAAELLAGRWTDGAPSIWLEGRHLTSAGRFAGRSIHGLLGVLSVYLAYRLGRRLSGRWVGIGAAAWVALLPFHVQKSGLINEDLPLVVCAQLALLASGRAVRRETPGAYLGAGAAIGLAMSTKFNAGLVSLPLGALGLSSGPAFRTRCARIGAAALVAALMVLAINPFLVADTRIYEHGFGKTARNCENLAARRHQTRAGVPVRAVGTLGSADYFGPWGLALAAVGGVGLGRRARLLRAGRRRELALHLAFPPLFVAGYAIATANVPSHTWLPIAPVLAALGAHGVRLLSRQLRAVPLDRRKLAAAAQVLLVLPIGWVWAHDLRWFHRESTPTCLDRAIEALGERKDGDDAPRLVGLFDGVGVARGAADELLRAANGIGLIAVPRSAAEAAASSVDILLVPGAPGESDWIARIGAVRTERFPPAWPMLRGPAVTRLDLGWRLVEVTPFRVALATRRAREAGGLPRIVGDEACSWTVELPGGTRGNQRAAKRPALLARGEPLPGTPIGLGGKAVYLSSKIDCSVGAEELTLHVAGAWEGAPAAARRWRFRRAAGPG